MHKILTIEEIKKLKISDNDKNLYFEAMKVGADIVLHNESDDGYDVAIIFSPKQNIQ